MWVLGTFALSSHGHSRPDRSELPGNDLFYIIAENAKKVIELVVTEGGNPLDIIKKNDWEEKQVRLPANKTSVILQVFLPSPSIDPGSY